MVTILLLMLRKVVNTFGEFQPKLFKIFEQGYDLDTLSKDFIAALMVAIVSLPLSMGLAVASGTTPEKGIFTAIVAGIVVALFGGGKNQISGPASAMVIVTFDVIQEYGYQGLLLSTLMAGVFLMIAGLARVGSVIKYIPYSVITGFTSGLALLLLYNQSWDIIGPSLADFNQMTCSMGVITIIAIVVIRHFFPKIPVLLFVMFFSAMAVWLLALDVPTIGSRFHSLPKMLPNPTIPIINIFDTMNLLPSAFTIAFLAGIDALMCGVIAEGMTGDRLRSNMELLAQGIANIACTFFGGIPTTATIARTVTNIKSGAKTPIAGILHGIFICLFLYLCSPIMRFIPIASLAAMLMVVAWDIGAPGKFWQLLRTSPAGDQIVQLSTLLLTVFVSITVAIQTGIILASLLFMRRMSQLTKIENDADIEIPEGVHVYHINGPFFFGAASRLRAVLNKGRQTKIYILNFVNVPLIDATGVQVLTNFVQRNQHQGIRVILSGLNPQNQDLLKRMGLQKFLPQANITPELSQAIALSRRLASVDPV